MKKLFQILTVAGAILAIYTALALDSSAITTARAWDNIIITAVLIAPGVIYSNVKGDDIV